MQKPPNPTVFDESQHVADNFVNLKIGYCNADGILSNFDDIQGFIVNQKFHIFAISETWLTDSQQVVFPGYFLFRNDRGLINLDSGRDTRGGGAAILVHNSLRRALVHKSRVSKIGEVEFLMAEISDSSQSWSILIVSVYRPPNGVCYHEFFSSLSRQKKKVFQRDSPR